MPSDSATCRPNALEFGFVELRPFADFASRMELEMELGSEVAGHFKGAGCHRHEILDAYVFDNLEQVRLISEGGCNSTKNARIERSVASRPDVSRSVNRSWRTLPGLGTVWDRFPKTSSNRSWSVWKSTTR